MSTEWYEDLALAMKRREKAKLYLVKWQEELEDAEKEIALLAGIKLDEKVDATEFEVDYSEAPGNYTVQGA